MISTLGFVQIHAQLRGEHAIEFDGDQAAGARGQHCGKRASARADLEHRPCEISPRDSIMTLRRRITYEEMLSELWLGAAAFAHGGLSAR